MMSCLPNACYPEKMPKLNDDLMRCAREAASLSYSPYSQFKVGAAVRWSDGTVTSGTNVENASYPVSVCAERHAVAFGVCSGLRELVAVAVWADVDEPLSPCGACRQVLLEFAPNPETVPVLMGCRGDSREMNLGELIPAGFRTVPKP
jgi:cytidine deaminase